MQYARQNYERPICYHNKWIAKVIVEATQKRSKRQYEKNLNIKMMYVLPFQAHANNETWSIDFVQVHKIRR